MISNTTNLNGNFGIAIIKIEEHFIYQVICKTDTFEIQCFLTETSEENAKKSSLRKLRGFLPSKQINHESSSTL